jgi:hypothetical protein
VTKLAKDYGIGIEWLCLKQCYWADLRTLASEDDNITGVWKI